MAVNVPKNIFNMKDHVLFYRECLVDKLFKTKAGQSMRNIPKWRFWKLGDVDKDLIRFIIDSINWIEDEDEEYLVKDFLMVEKYPDKENELSLILTFRNKTYEWAKDEYDFLINTKEDEDGKYLHIKCTRVDKELNDEDVDYL